MGTILAVSCSPRPNGNSAAIVDAVTDGAMGLSTNIIDLYSIAKLNNIHGCRACGACKRSGSCAIDDDIKVILDKIRDTDVLIISTPVYFGGPSSQYKTLEDRLYSFLGPDMKSTLPAGKRAVVVVTCSGPVQEAERVSRDIASHLEAVGFEIESEIAFSDNGGSVPAESDKEILTLAKGVGLRFRNT